MLFRNHMIFLFVSENGLFKLCIYFYNRVRSIDEHAEIRLKENCFLVLSYTSVSIMHTFDK